MKSRFTIAIDVCAMSARSTNARALEHVIQPLLAPLRPKGASLVRPSYVFDRCVGIRQSGWPHQLLCEEYEHQ
jgi:hypothetical protein